MSACKYQWQQGGAVNSFPIGSLYIDAVIIAKTEGERHSKVIVGSLQNGMGMGGMAWALGIGSHGVFSMGWHGLARGMGAATCAMGGMGGMMGAGGGAMGEGGMDGGWQVGWAWKAWVPIRG